MENPDNWDKEDDLYLSDLKDLWTSYKMASKPDDVTFEEYAYIYNVLETKDFSTDEEILDLIIFS